MEALTLRMNGMETTIADMMIKMNAYVIKTDGMMTAVETNDNALKTTVEVVKGTLETKILELQSSANQAIIDAAGIQQGQLQTLNVEMSASVNGIDTKIRNTNDLVTKLETAWIGSEQAQEDQKNRMIAMEQEVIKMAMESAEFKKQAESEIRRMKMEMEQGDESYTGKEKKDFYKPITEYKSITDLPKLTNDKSGFRDWRIRMKSSLMQIFRGSEFLKIMERIETPGTRLTGKEEID